jgi:hypothetical protein
MRASTLASIEAARGQQSLVETRAITKLLQTMPSPSPGGRDREAAGEHGGPRRVAAQIPGRSDGHDADPMLTVENAPQAIPFYGRALGDDAIVPQDSITAIGTRHASRVSEQ